MQALPEFDRREVIRLAAMSAAAGLAVSLADRGIAGTAEQDLPPRPDRPDIAGVTWDKAPCRFCGTGCHVQVGVRDGRVVAIAGDREAEVNKGLLCVKGLPRRRNPLRRRPPHPPDAAQGRPPRAHHLGGGDRDHRPADHGLGHPLRPLSLGPVHDSRGLRGSEADARRPREQPPRRQRAPLHGVGGHGVSSAPTASTSPPRASTTWIAATCSCSGATTQLRCTRSCGAVSSTVGLRGETVTIVDIGNAPDTQHGARGPLPRDAAER
jgi:hypothetical protein